MSKRFLLAVLALCCFVFSTVAIAAEFRPNIDGEKVWNLGEKRTKAGSEARKHLYNHAYYKELPADLYEGSLYWRERLQLRVDGRFDENLYVKYDIEEETDYPSKHNIYVKFFQHEFNFGDFEPKINGGPFATVNKRLNGFMYNSSFDKVNVLTIIGEERSDGDVFTVNGDGARKVFRMRHNPIVEGSLRVYVNNAKLREGRDYTVDYSTYTVTMTEAYSSKDLIKFIYDYTNPIEDFIPLDRQQFKAARVDFLMEAQTERVRVEQKVQEYLDVESKLKSPQGNTEENRENGLFQLKFRHIMLNSEKVEHNGKQLIRNVDYVVSYEDGTIQLPPREWTLFDRIKVYYTYYDYKEKTEKIPGVGTIGPYALSEQDVVAGSEKVSLNGHQMRSDEDYTLDSKRGMITLRRKIEEKDFLSVTYEYYVTVLPPKKGGTYNWLTGGMTYLQKRAKSKKGAITDSTTDQAKIADSISGRVASYETKDWPVKEDTLSVFVENYLLDLNTVSVNYDLGVVSINYDVATFDATAAVPPTLDLRSIDVSQAKVSLSYSYYREKGPLSYQFTGASDSEPYDLPGSGLVAYKYISSVPHSIKMDRDGTIIELRHKRGDGAFEVQEYGTDYEIVYEKDSLGRYNGQIGVVLYKQYSVFDATFGFVLDEEDVFEVEYYYAVKDASDPGFFQHDLLAADVHLNVSEKWRINLDTAFSSKEFQRGIESNVTGDALNETGRYNEIYVLSHKDIVEGSELFTFGGTERGDLEPGRDYYMNYARGELRFIGFAPKAEDDIIVYYDYYDSNSGADSERQTLTGWAARVDTSYIDDGLEVRADYTGVQSTFKPFDGVNGLNVPPGSTEWGTDIKYSLLDGVDVYAGKRRTRTETKERQAHGDSEDSIVYQVTETDRYGILYKPLSWLTVDGYYRNETQVSDELLVPPVSGNTHTIDTQLGETGLKMSVGPDNFLTRINYKSITKESDFLDKYNHQSDVSKILELTNTYIPFSNLRIDSECGLSDSFIRDNVAHRLKSSNEKTYCGIGMTSTWLSSVNLDASFKVTKIDKTPSYNAEGEVVSSNRDYYELKDRSYLIAYEPRWDIDALKYFRVQFKEDYSEKDGLAQNQRGDIKDVRNYSMRLSPYGRARLNYAGTESDSNESDGNINKDTYSSQFTITSFSPFNWLTLTNAGYRKSDSSYVNLIPSNASENRSNSDFEKTEYTFEVRPWDTLKYTHAFATETSDDTNTTVKLPTSNRRYTDREKYNRKQELSVTLPDMSFARLWTEPWTSSLTLGNVGITAVHEKADESSYVRTRYYPTQNLLVASYSDESFSVKETEKMNLSLTARPALMIDTKADVANESNFIVTTGTNGNRTLEKNITDTLGIDLSYPLNRLFTIEAAHDAEVRREWSKTATAHVSETAITRIFDKKKHRDKRDFTLGIVYHMTTYLDFETAGAYSLFNENSEDRLAPTSNELAYERYTLIPSIALKVDRIIEQQFGIRIGDLRLKHSFYFDYFRVGGKSPENGCRALMTVDYTPLLVKNVKGTLTYKRYAVWGVNTNEAQQQKDQQLGLNTADTEIRRQDYLEEEGKANLEITVPIGNAPVQDVIDNVKINLSAVLVNAHDGLNSDSDKNYYLWSWLGSVKIAF